MTRSAVNFVGPGYRDDSLPVSAQECINWVPELVEAEGARSAWVLKDAPGHTLAFSLDGADELQGIRGWLGTQVRQDASVTNRYVDRLFTVLGTKLIVSDPAVGQLSVADGEDIVGVGIVQMAYNGSSVLIATGSPIPQLYAYNLVPEDAVKASVTIQDITYTALTAGDAGNSISIEYVLPDPTEVLPTAVQNVGVDSTQIVVTLGNRGRYSGNYDVTFAVFPTIGGSGPGGDVAQYDYYVIVGTGALSGVPVNNGDIIRALVDLPGQDGSLWTINSTASTTSSSDIKALVDALPGVVVTTEIATGQDDETQNEVEQTNLTGGTDALLVQLYNITTKLPFSPGGVTFCNGYYAVPEYGGARWCISGLNDYTFDGLDVATAESATDSLLRIFESHGQLWLFGTDSIEVWDNTGAAAFPFARSNGATMERGLGARSAVTKFDNSVAWIGENGVIYHANGYSPIRISTLAIEQDILLASFADAIMYAYRDGGHDYLVLHLDGASGRQELKTWVYDASTKLWHRRKSFGIPNWLATYGVAFGARNLIASNVRADDCSVFELSDLVSDEAGNPLVRERVTGYLSANQQPLQMNSLEFVMRTGHAAQTGTVMQTDPVVELRYSDDFAGNWCNWKQRALGPIGHLIRRVRFTQLGRFRNRVFHIRVSDPTRCDFVAAVVNGEPGQQQ